jgi:NADH:ubiquinone oxidoreductase subunit 5 (subunit L)/multisubunit Na+/H+ antiporter MnhA subunit
MTMLGMSCVGFTLCALLISGLAALFSIRLSETFVTTITSVCVAASLVCATLMLAVMLVSGSRFVSIDIGNWVSIQKPSFHFHVRVIFDRLSIPFLILSLVLCGVVGSFAKRYLHLERGFFRFFLLYNLFLNGIVISTVAGTIETLFLGWEMVGLSSALLVAYFHERENPVRNGQWIWAVYRLADAAFLMAAISMHHLTGAGDFASFVGSDPWPMGTADLSSKNALLVGLLLLLAAAGKSALVPFSGWLGRAMEGPTPSTAVFYGALSVHLGAYLLLRVNPVLEASYALRMLVLFFGIVSALTGTCISRVQSDVKSALAYSSLTQVGIIIIEIGLGFYYLALIHIIGHACLRTLQLLRAPTLITDYLAIANAIGHRDEEIQSAHRSKTISRFRRWQYLFGIERGFMDSVLIRFAIQPFLAFFQWSNRQEQRWTKWLSKEPRSDGTEKGSLN